MKVLHITTAYPYPLDRGIVPWLVRLLNKLKEKGIEIEVFTSSYLGKEDGGMEREIKIHRFRYSSPHDETLSYNVAIPEQIKKEPVKTYLKVIKYLHHGFLKAKKLAKEKKYDIVHVHWPLPMAVMGLPFSKMGTPLIYSFYTAEVVLTKRFPLLKRAFSPIIKKGSCFLFNSSFTRDSFFSLFPQFKSTMNHVLHTSSSFEEEEMRKPKVKVREGMVLFVGRLVERKGVTYLIKAIEQMKDEKIRLTVVGDGPEYKSLKNYVREKKLEDRVIFTGRVSDDELKKYYRNADLFVLPAIVDSKGDTEGLGVVLLEALINGIPVIASKVGGIIDIVEHEKTGLLVKEKDPDSLAEAIKRMLKDEELRKNTVLMGQKKIREEFSLESLSEKLIDIYREVTLEC